MTEEAKTKVVAGADIYANMAGELWQYQNDMWKRMNRERLLYEKPAKLSALVYEVIDDDMITGYESEETMDRYIANLMKLAGKAPEGCKVVVRHRSEGDYEGGSNYFRQVGFYRPPTDEEVEERKARNAEIAEVQAEAAAAKEVREREEFERLQAKFASDSD